MSQPPAPPIPPALSYELYRAITELWNWDTPSRNDEEHHRRYQRVRNAHEAIAEWIRGEYGEDADEEDDQETAEPAEPAAIDVWDVISDARLRDALKLFTQAEEPATAPNRVIDRINAQVRGLEMLTRFTLSQIRTLQREYRDTLESDKGLFENGVQAARITSLEETIRTVLQETRHEGGVGRWRAMLMNGLEGRDATH